MRDSDIIVGVDGGGTKTIAIAYKCNGELIGKGLAGPSNFQSVGVETAVNNIKTAVGIATNGAFPSLVYLGLAGVNTNYGFNTMREALRELGKEVYIDSDAFIALFAETEGSPGVLAISGTGSVVVGYDGKRRYKHEGLGWLIGDIGSAYWVGREALRELGKALDGAAPRTIMIDILTDRLGSNDVEGILRWAYFEGHACKVTDIASLATAVNEAAERGDEVARDILKRASEGLGRYALIVSRETNVDVVYAAGGMFRSRIYSDYFINYLAINGLKGELAKHEPIHGALMSAFKMGGCKGYK